MGRGSTRHRDELIVALRDGGETLEDIGRVLNMTRERVRQVYSEATRVGFPGEFAERFWSQVRKSEGCWEWMGTRDPSGYGLTYFGAALKAYRVAWELTHGPIPAGLHVCHACDNPPCCRPDHLWLGTHRDNMDDMVAKGRSVRGRTYEAGPRPGLGAIRAASALHGQPAAPTWVVDE